MGKVLFAFVLFAALASSAQAYLWSVSGNSPIYPALPRPMPAVSQLQFGHCGDYGTNCVYYENAPFSTYGSYGQGYWGNFYGNRAYALQKPLLPGLGLVGWRYENGRYVRDVYEGYGNARLCQGRHC